MKLLTKVAVGVIVGLIASIVIQNLVAVSEFSQPVAVVFSVVIPVLIGLGAASKVGNKKEQAE